MIKWIKSWFKKETKTVSAPVSLPDGKKVPVEPVSWDDKLLENRKKYQCSKHPKYNGIHDPKENCNDCWEFHYKVSHHII